MRQLTVRYLGQSLTDKIVSCQPLLFLFDKKIPSYPLLFHAFTIVRAFYQLDRGT